LNLTSNELADRRASLFDWHVVLGFGLLAKLRMIFEVLSVLFEEERPRCFTPVAVGFA
jgi:hypothetical protein